MDRKSLDLARKNLGEFRNRVEFYCFNFVELFDRIDLKNSPVSGILIDPGISMFQLKESGRGFSHARDDKLDMRKSSSLKMSAADVIGTFTESQLIDIFEKYGELSKSRELAKKIIERRLFGSVDTTFKLKDIVDQVYGKKTRKGRAQPAARVFQALRIFVNRELEGIDSFIGKLAEFLKTGARIVCLSYHSLEDRMVKNTMKHLHQQKKIEILKPFPGFPGEDEIEINPASHSARLRAAQVI
jgi:16S rRNA (cytosine1402-N4)-methyltransferase